jgi:hypothetical protein
MKESEEINENSDEETATKGRRNFLKKAGKFAIYTPPAMMLMIKPSYATFNKSMVGRPKHKKKMHHGKKHQSKRHHWKKYQRKMHK